MKPYSKPEAHFIRLAGELCGKELAELSNEELAAYLGKNGFTEEKKKYRIREGFVLRQIAGEAVIVPVGANLNELDNALMLPNEAAAFLWQAFQTPCTKQDAVVRAQEAFSGRQEEVRQDVEKFVAESLQMKILEEVL